MHSLAPVLEKSSAQNKVTRILGIDPGTLQLGWALWDHPGGLVKCDVDKLPSALSVASRVEVMVERMANRLDFDQLFYGVRLIAIERQFSKQNGADESLKALQLLFTGMAKERDIRMVRISVAQARRRVAGHGRAPKESVRQLLEMEFRRELRSDEADAICIAMAACDEVSS